MPTLTRPLPPHSGDGDASGLQLARNLALDMTWLHPTAWSYWQVLDGGGWGCLDATLEGDGMGVVAANLKWYRLAQFTRHLRKGMVIMSSGGEDTVAAYDASAQTLVLVTTVYDIAGGASVEVTYDLVSPWSRRVWVGPLLTPLPTLTQCAFGRPWSRRVWVGSLLTSRRSPGCVCRGGRHSDPVDYKRTAAVRWALRGHQPGWRQEVQVHVRGRHYHDVRRGGCGGLSPVNRNSAVRGRRA